MGMPVNDLSTLFLAQHGGGALAAMPQSTLPASINVCPASENLAWTYHTLGNSAAKSGTTKAALVNGRRVMLGEVTFAGVYGVLNCNLSGGGYTPFIVGKPYLVSCYVWSPVDFWHNKRAMPGTPGYGQGAVWCRAGELTRVWWVGYAYSTTALDLGSAPTATAGSQNDGFVWMAVNNNYAGTLASGAAPFIGGFMIESLPSGYKDGVALIGDSTFAGSSGWATGGATADRMYDFNTMANREVSVVLGSELRIPIFNRAIGGQRLDQMDSRWASDITPLASRCGAAIIQGGINDIGQGRTLAQMQASTLSMRDKAAADGLSSVYYPNVTPFAAASASAPLEALRRTYNDWLASTFGAACCDIASVVTDSGTGKDLSSAAYGDGTHFTGAAKTAIAAKMVQSLNWTWRITPSAYVPTVL